MQAGVVGFSPARNSRIHVRVKRVISGLCVLAMLSLLGMTPAWGSPPAGPPIQSGADPQAAGAVQIYLSPSTATAYLGQTFTLTVWVATGAQPIDSVSIIVNYNGAVLDNTNITNGTTLPYVLKKVIGGTTGVLRYDAGQLGSQGVTGTFVLCTLYFRALALATNSPVNFAQVQVYKGGEPVPFSVTNARVNVTTPPPPTATPTVTPTPTAVLGNICVLVFNDRNGNEMREVGEELVAGAVLTLTNSLHEVIGTYTTNGVSEPYCFRTQGAGFYFLREQNPPGWVSTSPDYWGLAMLDGTRWDVEIGDRWVGEATPTPTPMPPAPTQTPTPTSTPTRSPTPTPTSTPVVPTPTPTPPAQWVEVRSSIPADGIMDPLSPIELMFDAPMITETVELLLVPAVPYHVEWSEPGTAAGAGAVGYRKAVIHHEPFTPRTGYVLGVTEGQSVSGLPVRPTFWSFVVPGMSLLFPLVRKSY